MCDSPPRANSFEMIDKWERMPYYKQVLQQILFGHLRRSEDEKTVVFHQPIQDDTENKRIIFTLSVCIGNRSQESESRSQKAKAETTSVL
jgi:hypothetical protein